MPARVTRRDDFPTVGASNRNGGRRDDSPPAKNLFHTFPPVPVPVEPRRQGDARATENLGGFDIEKMVATTIEYSRERRALREEITAVQRELARVASERNAERERILAWEGDLLELGLREVNRRTKTLAASMGFLFALGRALDQAQFPGKKFGMFNEVCVHIYMPLFYMLHIHTSLVFPRILEDAPFRQNQYRRQKR